jgi:hypothetical protein
MWGVIFWLMGENLRAHAPPDLVRRCRPLPPRTAVQLQLLDALSLGEPGRARGLHPRRSSSGSHGETAHEPEQVPLLAVESHREQLAALAGTMLFPARDKEGLSDTPLRQDLTTPPLARHWASLKVTKRVRSIQQTRIRRASSCSQSAHFTLAKAGESQAASISMNSPSNPQATSPV